MPLSIGIVEGWKGPLDFALLDDGSATNLAGMTVTGQARNRLQADVALSGNVTLLDATGGTVRMIPDTSDFLAADSPYELRIKVVDGAGRIVFYPNDEATKVIVRI